MPLFVMIKESLAQPTKSGGIKTIGDLPEIRESCWYNLGVAAVNSVSSHASIYWSGKKKSKILL